MLSLNKDLEFDSCVASLLVGYLEGIRLLTQARGLLKRKEGRIVQNGRNRAVMSSDLEHAMTEYKLDTWRRILARMFMKKQVSACRFHEIQAQILTGEVPELTAENLRRVVKAPPSSLPY
jgi:hypothetical protein